jgi:magnesium transporter
LNVLRKKAEDVEEVYNVYAVDQQRILRGVVSLKDLVLATPKAKLSEIMDKDCVSIRPEMDQEKVANLFLKYDLISAPVVDEEGRLVGRITVDDVLDVVEEEASEDMTLMAGITDEKIRERSIFRQSGVRLPWLLVAFVGEMISALVLSRFRASLNQIVASAFFIPLIMAMGGNTGIQSATIVIRGLGTGDINLRDTSRQLLKEIGVALLNGFIISLLLFGVVSLWQGDPKFGLILSCSMIAVLINAAFMGTLIPFFLKRIGVDPAIATGPFITTSNDVLGLVVYFGMMSIFFGWM